MVRRPVDSSIRSRHTGHVGSSIKAGVGGAGGLEERELEDMGTVCRVDGVEVGGKELVTDGVKGSLVISGNEAS